ncbi:porin [Magnetospirillum sulfuroxidans]|uniref:Porin n=1 Tax=Magnetospirillum sulfuroxidans TaxID=611300 RepID=A0ABS5IEZ5_9PROT|nr:porin [Magnetospirillum sulfuroxidans]MBR9972762.1 porin [Magnetospirillum sulfuroxidans]
MKKILIASTALVAAGMITAGSASASEKIKLNLGGYSKWWVVGAWQDSGYEAAFGAGSGSANNVDVQGENEVWFGGSTTLDNGLQVGIDMQLRTGGRSDSNTAYGTADVIDESYVWVSGGFGKVIVGTENNGTYLLHVTAPDAAGNWNEGGVMMGNQAIARPASVTTLRGGNTTAILTDGDADKITYVAPAFYGLTLGASYVPNTSEDNQNVYGSGGSSFSAASEIYGVGALYANTFGGVGVKVSAGYVTYDVAAATDRSQELAFGTQLSYAGFTLGGSYRNQSENAAQNQSVTNTGYGWDVGLQYATGPYAVSLAYFNSKVQGSATVNGEDEVTAYQLSGKYNMGAGVDLLASVGHIEYDGEEASVSGGDVNHNEGWTVMTGLSLQF